MLGNRIDDLEENSGSLGLGSYIDLDNCVKVLIPSSSYARERIHYPQSRLLGKGFKALALICEGEFGQGNYSYYNKWFDYRIIEDWQFIEKKINETIEKQKELNRQMMFFHNTKFCEIHGVWENNKFDFYFLIPYLSIYGASDNERRYFTVGRSFPKGRVNCSYYGDHHLGIIYQQYGYKLYGLK